MFKWTIIVLLALTNLCFFILVMPLEETLSPQVSLWIYITVGNYCYTFSTHISSRRAFTSSTFSLKLPAQQTILEMILLFSVFIDSAELLCLLKSLSVIF